MGKRYSPISKYSVEVERKRKYPQIHREGRSDQIIMSYGLRGQDPNLPTMVSLEVDLLLALGSRHEMASRLYKEMLDNIRYWSNTSREVSPKLGFYRRTLKRIDREKEIRRIERALENAGIMKHGTGEAAPSFPKIRELLGREANTPFLLSRAIHPKISEPYNKSKIQLSSLLKSL